MWKFKELATRFAHDTNGAFMVLFGIMALVLVAMAGAVVDYTMLQEHRSRAQIALDSAALSLQPEIYKQFNENEILRSAQALVADRLSNTNTVVNVDTINIDTVAGSIKLHGKLTVPMNFVKLVGVNQIEATIFSEAIRKKRALEISLALDNSASMLEYNRMAYLQEAAACAVRTLFYSEVNAKCMPATGAKKVEDVRIGLVPFTMYVNVGADQKNQTWLDWTGLAPVSNDNFTGGPNGRTNRTQLFANSLNSSGQKVAWQGCVVAREYPYDVNDATPILGANANSEQSKTLFTPLFSPDFSDKASSSGNYLNDTGGACPIRTCTHVQNQTRPSSRGSWSTVSNVYTQTIGNSTSKVNSCNTSNPQLNTSTSTNGNSRAITTVYSLDTQRVLQEQVCKYDGQRAKSGSSPNAECPAASITPLTDDDTLVVNRIKAMVALGGTNIHEGTAWAMRTLSPNAPFEEAAPYHEDTSKVLIIMTDGENTLYPNNDGFNNASYYSAYGMPYNQRLGNINSTQSQLTALVDKRTLETCASAKALGMQVFTIGLSSPDSTKAMLTTCASTPGNAYFPDKPTDLMSVFKSIANELSALRLAQ